jgi:glycosyltransferase involved in cell wall biosynthesis
VTGVPLRVTLDASAVPAEPGGAGFYVIELAAALGRRDDVDLVVLTRRGDADRWRTVPATVTSAVPARRPARLVWEQARMPALLDDLGPAVHHSPHYTMPERARVPVVVTVHDLTFFDHPEWHERQKVVLFRRAIRTVCRRAAAIVCVSATTADRLRAVCEVSVPVVVAPHGVDHRRFRPDDPVPGSDEAALAGLGLDPSRRLVVFVGTLEPRKGVAGLVRAFDAVAGRHEDVQLVLAGQRGWGPDDVGRAIGRARHGERVVRTGYVPDAAVPALLRRAAAVAYPALEEGYGLPALEALACGAPLVTTSGTAMAEMAGGAALLVGPGDVDGLAGALDAILSGGATAAARDRRRAGLAAAAARTWDRSAELHMAGYRAAADAGLRP